VKHHLWSEVSQSGWEYVSLDAVVEAIEYADEAVIRCEDCGRCGKNLLDESVDYWCVFFGHEMEPDDFCSKAKPRKKEPTT